MVVTVTESWNRYGKTVFAQRQESPEERESYWGLLGDQGSSSTFSVTLFGSHDDG